MFSPHNCFKHSNKLRTVRDVLNSKSKTLGAFKRDYGRDWVIAYVSMWLIDLNDSSNVKNKMSDAQIEFTSERIYDSYSLKVADLTLFFRNIKEGVYGSYYENLSQEKIMSWLSEYFDHRCEMAQMVSSVKHEEFSTKKDKMHPKVFENMFKGVGEEKVEYNHESSGLGKRTKNVINIDFKKKAQSLTTKELRNYLVDNNIKSKTYNEEIYKIVEDELDLRNSK